MILSFHIEYRTSWGEEVRVLGSILELGNNQPGKAIPLQTVDGIHWTLDADIQAPENGIVQYSYHIYRDGKDTFDEIANRIIELPLGQPGCLDRTGTYEEFLEWKHNR